MFGVWWGFIFRRTTPWTRPPSVGWAGPRLTPGPPSGPACAPRTSATWCQMVSDQTWHVQPHAHNGPTIKIISARNRTFLSSNKAVWLIPLHAAKNENNKRWSDAESQHSSKSAFYVVFTGLNSQHLLGWRQMTKWGDCWSVKTKNTSMTRRFLTSGAPAQPSPAFSNAIAAQY